MYKEKTDERNKFVKSDLFAHEIQKTDNYYVIVSREGLPSLPYSVKEIYGIRTLGKYGILKQSYHEFYRIYGTDVLKQRVKPDIVITEDSNSGFQFFKSVCNDNGLACVSAGGKSNIFHCLKTNNAENLLIIADGAAFGSEIDKVLHLIKEQGHGALYLPESFEWLILLSGIFNNRKIDHILNDPSVYIESSQYFSWERFFTALLIEQSKDTYLVYSKKNLCKAYLSEKIKSAVLAKMEKIELIRE